MAAIEKGSRVFAIVHGKRQLCEVTWTGCQRGQQMALVETLAPLNVSLQRLASLQNSVEA